MSFKTEQFVLRIFQRAQSVKSVLLKNVNVHLTPAHTSEKEHRAHACDSSAVQEQTGFLGSVGSTFSERSCF